MKRHLIGIGGVGMSALATALVRLGDEVTGADRTLNTPNIRFLESIGVKCFPDDGSGVDSSVGEIVVSTAIEDTNPALAKAKELGIGVTHRARALARALDGRKLVAVAGTCGKSTVTAMLGHILGECGLDPFCVNGANVPGWEGAVRFGRGEFAVAEVDESDKSLVAFRPYAAIVTNASADHYSKEEMDEVFDNFIAGIPGPLVDGRRGVALSDLSAAKLAKVLPMPGRHNLQNAALAVTMAVALGCREDEAVAAMASFRGVERRLQFIGGGEGKGPAVYDDYAHNPEKLRAMLTTLAEKYDAVCAVWRPHGYAPLRKMMEPLAKMFGETLRPGDRLLLLPVYDAGGTADRSVNSGQLARMLERTASGRCIEVADLDAAYGWMDSHRSGFSAFVTCGARDPGLASLARRLV